LPRAKALGNYAIRYLMQYLAWRCTVGLQETIALSFLTVGHTKFSPDWCLGLFKRRHRHTRISCLYDKVCEKLRVKAAKGGKAKSCVVLEQSAEVNAVQFAGAQDGTVIVPTYDWADHFTLHSARVPYGASNTFASREPHQERCL
jgi:hypothetical protein